MAQTIVDKSTGVTFAGTQTIEEKEYYDKQLELIIKDDGGLSEYFESDSQPYNTGKKFTYRKMLPITPPDKPLEEGVVPDPNKIALREYEGSMSPWGDYLVFSDEAKKYTADDLIGSSTTQLGYSATELMNQRRALAMTTSRNRWFAGLDSSQITGTLDDLRVLMTAFDLEDLPKISAYLKKLHVKPYTGTDYVILIPTEIESSLLTLKKSATQYSFIELTKNANYQPVLEGEIGRILGFRFVTNPYLKVEDGKAKCIILGKYQNKKGLLQKGVGFKPGESKPSMIIKDFGSAGVNDPLNQKASVGYKIDAWTAVVTADQAVLVYECKAEIAFKDEYPDLATTGLIKQVNIGGETGDIKPNASVANGKVDSTIADAE
ncbi:MAG: N4-gp56 family major capsid protein [Candidatus Coprovivens sp.]